MTSIIELRVRRPQKGNRLLVGLLCLLFWQIGIYAGKADGTGFSDNKTHVLFLHSYHKGMLWVESVTRGFENGLPFHTDRIVHVEYMDAKRHPQAEQLEATREYYRKKFAGVNFSAIATVDDIAFAFALKNRKELFNNAPIVFCGINFFNAEVFKNESNFTGVVERNDFLKTINLAFSLHPGTDKVYIVNDGTETGRANQEAINQLRPFLPSGKEIRFSGNLPMHELKEKIAALPDNYIILLLSYNQDAFGKYFSYRELGKNVREVAKRPIYSVWDFFFDGCATGGCITRGFDQGSIAASMVKRILNGEKADRIAVESRYLSRYMFDYNKLQEFSVPESRLPENSIILNRPYSFYRENSTLFWQIATVIFSFGALSAGLAISLLKLLKSQKDLEEGRQSLRITLDSIGEGVIATDAEARITRINPLAEQITGWAAIDAKGKKLSEVFAVSNDLTGKPCKDIELTVFKAKAPVTFGDSHFLTDRNGKKLPINATATTIRDEFGNTFGIVAVFRDMTENNNIQEKLRQSQKMDAIGQLAGGVAHDFNNALTGIIGAVQLLQNEINSDFSNKILKLIEKSADRAADLTAKLLAFSRKSNLETSPQSLHQIIRAASDILSRTIDRRIQIQKKLDAETDVILANVSELESVLLNLGINASHAMTEGGCMAFSTSIVDLDAPFCEASTFQIKPGRYILLEVSDTGTGIAQQNLERIFEPFFTTKELGKGTGLGLSAAYGTIVQHHGAISVTSRLQHGTTFSIYLPLIDEVAENHEKSPEIIPGSGTILLIDDEPAIRFTNRLLLESAGYKVLLAENGRDGLEKFNQAMTDIDLVILDMIMPEMNGSECFNELIKIRPDLKIIICSGFPQDADLAEMKKKGTVSFLFKPCRGQELTRVVAEMISPGSSS